MRRPRDGRSLRRLPGPTVSTPREVVLVQHDLDLATELHTGSERQPVAAPEPAGVVPVAPPVPLPQQPHLLQRQPHHFGAVRALEPTGRYGRPATAREPAREPSPREFRRRRERCAVEPRDRAQQLVLLVRGDRHRDLPQPAALAVTRGPHLHRTAQVVQLHAALVPPGPHVRETASELGVPHQRRQVLERDRHPHVVHRCVGQRLDCSVGRGGAAEDPQVPRAGRRHGLVEGETRTRTGGPICRRSVHAVSLPCPTAAGVVPMTPTDR